ncbi:hypothetical protein [uncultured Thermanaerothrix sp.]|uniref:hypothetical protein n=1 Tax=uncultured Thermanaerothrix sp. TaxID=1195149 RepID=UPI0026303FC9|nr:hypothetical protein [uncultured Thermanaerothrix sp.]
MSSHRLILPYKSGWYTVLLPTLICLGVWGGLVVGVPALMGWDMPNWLGTLLCLGGFIPGLVIAVVTYPFLLRLAERGRGELMLEGNRLRWRIGLRWREVDFGQPYEAQISAGLSGQGEYNARVSFSPGGEIIHLREARREEVLRLFPAPYFVDTLAVLPAEGAWGFELSAAEPVAVAFFSTLLECLWRTRHNNRRFRLYQKFPWERRPNPAFRHIRIFDPSKAEERAFVEGLRTQVISSLDYLELTPDYLMGWLYRSPDNPFSQIEGYAVMPLGFITAEAGLKRLTVYGKGQDSMPLQLTFGWYEPADEKYEEAEFLLRFVQAMQEVQ